MVYLEISLSKKFTRDISHKLYSLADIISLALSKQLSRALRHNFYFTVTFYSEFREEWLHNTEFDRIGASGFCAVFQNRVLV